MSKIGKLPPNPATIAPVNPSQPVVQVQINNHFSTPAGVEMNQAWQVFANAQAQTFVGTQSLAQSMGTSPLRQQIAYALDPNSQVSKFFNVTHLASQWDIPTDNLLLNPGAPVGMNPSLTNPTLTSPSPAQPAPLATPKTPAGPTAHPERKEAAAEFDRILEKHHSPFDTKADNMARDLSKQPGKLDALTTKERARLVTILGSGVVSEADEEAIVRIMKSAKNPQEFYGMLDMAGGSDRVAGLVDGRELKELKFLAEKHSTTSGTVDHPRREEARSRFEEVLRASVNTFDTKSDNKARALARDPEMLEALTPIERGRLIKAMGSGMVSERDEEGIINVLRSSQNAGEFWSTVQTAGGTQALHGMVDWKEEGQLRFLLEKFTQGYGVQSPSSNASLSPANNPYSVPPVASQSGVQSTPAYNWGTATGLGQPYDMGFGGQTMNQEMGRLVGGFFKGLMKGIGTILKTAVQMAIPAAIGFAMGGPAGAAMGAANGLLGSDVGKYFGILGGGAQGMGSMVGSFSSANGFGAAGSDPVMNFLFTTMMNSANPAGSYASLLGPLV